METVISNKDELLSLATELDTKTKELIELGDELSSKIKQVEGYDEFNILEAANVLSGNIEVVTEDLNIVSTNINSYATQLIGFDIDDFGSGIEAYLSGIPGNAITLPGGLGSVHSYMGWQCITSKSSMQYKLREAAGMNFDQNGFGKIGDRYVVATTSTFGKVGDYIDVVQADGSIIKCIIGDIKSQGDAGCTQWGHNNGQCVVEFVVDKNSWYKTNKTVTSFHPDWNQTISQIVNKGNYFDSPSISNTLASEVSSPEPESSISLVDDTKEDTTIVKTNPTPIVTSSTAVATATVVTSSSKPVTVSASTSSSKPATYESVSVTSESKNNSIPSSEAINQTKDEVIKELTPIPENDTLISQNTNVDLSKYSNNPGAGFEVTAGNATYNLNEGDFNLLCAIVSAECDKSYDDALAVITTILNRCEAPNWVSSFGTNPIAQATAPNQFVVYQHGSYRQYLGNTPGTVITAVKDALAGVRNHHYLSFRSNSSASFSNNMITSSGNRYR